MGAWIRMLSDAEADADLADALAGARTPHGTVDNVLRVHSLRPNTMRKSPSHSMIACGMAKPSSMIVWAVASGRFQ